MKTTLWSCVIFGAAVALSAGIAAGGVGDLTYAKTVPPGLSYGGTSVLMKTPADPAALGLKHPKAMATGKGAAVAVAFDSNDPKAETLDIARIDTTGKGSFADATVIKLTKASVRQGYTMLTLAPQAVTITRNGKKIPALVSGRYYKYQYRSRNAGANAKPQMRISATVSVQVAGVGQCRFGDTVRKVCVLDSNRNMTVGDVTVTKRGTREYKRADYCRIADANGKFSRTSRAGYVQMGQPVQIDGKWYTLSAENMKIAAKQMTGGLGMLSINSPRWQCMLTRDGLTLNLSGGAKPVSVPAGKYQVRTFRLYRQADATRPSASIYGSSSKPLTITADKTTSFTAGQDMTATMSARANKGKVRFSVSQADSSGSRIRGIYGSGGKRPTAPQIEVVNKAGKVIYNAKLAYG